MTRRLTYPALVALAALGCHDAAGVLGGAADESGLSCEQRRENLASRRKASRSRFPVRTFTRAAAPMLGAASGAGSVPK